MLISTLNQKLMADKSKTGGSKNSNTGKSSNKQGGSAQGSKTGGSASRNKGQGSGNRPSKKS